ncbi:hypothetical protein [Acidimangrovimonas pyrenivorans]|uniref:Uncharacterized protein n=1 Tax=Acidimangrovimonas pyrenivorans TaxID=2030798 RepID=A0ABV7AIG7_9RHOB
MRRIASLGGLVLGLALGSAVPAAAAGSATRATHGCAKTLTRDIPARPAAAPSGSAVMNKLLDLSGSKRDAAVRDQLLAGNVPGFLRDLAPVRFSGTEPDGSKVEVTICVTPDYLAVGNDRDFVRVPLGLPAAAEVADRFGFLLPTPKMVDAIYRQAQVRLAPSPMQPGRMMTSTAYLLRHNHTVQSQRARLGVSQDELTAGDKKDVVLSARLRRAPGKVAIYGWHRSNGRPIQPLSTVHVARYADYSHGIRLVSDTAFVNGKPVPLATVMQDPKLAALISREGPIAKPRQLLASLYR